MASEVTGRERVVGALGAEPISGVAGAALGWIVGFLLGLTLGLALGESKGLYKGMSIEIDD